MGVTGTTTPTTSHPEDPVTTAVTVSRTRLASRLESWLSAQRTDPPGPGRWLAVYVETEGMPRWWRGQPITGHDVVQALGALAAEGYVLRRVTRAGGDVRLVEVWSR